MRLAGNILWNAAGLILPLLVGLLSVPIILRGLGTERFGFLSIIWMLIGYFSVFDLGLSRTLTKWVADARAAGRDAEVASVTSTTLYIVAISSVALSIVLAVCAPWIAGEFLNATSDLTAEATAAIRWLSLSLPFVLVATVWTGLLEGYQKFGSINMVRVPMGSLLLAAPLAVLPFSKSIAPTTAVLALLRVLNALILMRLAFREVPVLRQQGFGYHRELVRPLLTYGGWLTVSNVVGPLMVYFDRFLIAALLGSAAVAYYTVPYDVLNRLLLLPTAIQGVLFPTFALLHGQQPARLRSVFARSSTTTLILMLPALLGTMLLANEALQVWVGSRIADASAGVARILIVGVIYNAIARTPFVFVQGAGHAKWTAILHLVEFPFYALALWLLVSTSGSIESAAYVWTFRVIIDAVALYVMTLNIDTGLKRTAARDVIATTGACIVAVLLDLTLSEELPRLLVTLAVALACATMLLRQLAYLRPLSTKRSSSAEP